MPSFKALLSYDGTAYFGWQKTKTGPSIQESVSQAIHRITGETVLPEAASRTDRGVHAEGQSIQFHLEGAFDPRKLQRGLNAVLAPDIRAVHLEAAPDRFHPTIDAAAKEYHYRLSLGPAQDPLLRLYSWHFRYPLDLAKMELAAKDLLGTRDFTAFANEPEKDPICTLQEIRIEISEEGRLQIAMIGNRFLYKMARTLAGTIVYIGCGKLPPDCIPALFTSRNRKMAGITAPAHGLYLYQVFYNNHPSGIVAP